MTRIVCYLMLLGVFLWLVADCFLCFSAILWAFVCLGLFLWTSFFGFCLFFWYKLYAFPPPIAWRLEANNIMVSNEIGG